MIADLVRSIVQTFQIVFLAIALGALLILVLFLAGTWYFGRPRP